MELIDIIPSESKLWEQAWRLYTESFPEHERRRISSHHRAVDDQRFYTKVAVDNGHLTALLFYWTFGVNNIYIEHIAVNPLMRGKNIGSRLLADFIAEHGDANIFLEIDPPADEISVRRLGFYERLGFKNTGFIFRHPSYQKKGMEHDLLVLSHPAAVDSNAYDTLIEFLRGEVLKYID